MTEKCTNCGVNLAPWEECQGEKGTLCPECYEHEEDMMNEDE